ncbi:MAG: M56 family metallopeptidase [Wenzhouxiangellaceae bacterium]
MNEWFGLLAILAGAAVVGAALGAMAALPASSRLLSDSLTPATRCRRVELLALLPLGGALLGITALLLPALLKLIGVIDDHCLEHGLHHPHFCLRHLPEFSPGLLSTGILLLIAFPIAALSRIVADGFAQGRLIRAMQRMAGTRRVLIKAETETPQAFVFGLRRPHIVLSTGLLRVLTPAERRAVVRHEIAHARAADPIRGLLLDLALTMHLPAARASLQRCWRQAIEERADDAVAAEGHGLALASALVRWLRLGQGRQSRTIRPEPHALAANAGNVSHRIRRLAAGRQEVPGSAWFERLLAAGASFLVLVLTGAHHSIETLVGWL